MKIATPVPGVTAQAGGAGSPAAILAIGAGAFLILLAYTGKLQGVWTAAFGSPLQTIDNAITGGTHGETGSGNGAALDPSDPLAGGGAGCAIPGDFKGGSDLYFARCKTGGCPANTIPICTDTGRKACTTGQVWNDAQQVLHGAGWKVCGATGAGGEAFGVSLHPLGAWHTAPLAKAVPAASWGFA